MRIVFIGTADFGIPSLNLLLQNNYNIVGVITSPDKPAGRGLNLSESPVKQFAKTKNLKILQPKNLKDESFLRELKSLDADLQLVIAFRMLPHEVWEMPPLGTFNLHASLLPQYRGAAPINWAIINGEKETGVTTFFLKHEIDTGKIIYQKKISIDENENAGQLHDKLMHLGAKLVLKSVQVIEQGNYPQAEQRISPGTALNKAPKIYRENCKISWNQPAGDVFNLIRGLSPYPAAWCSLDGKTFKIYAVKKEIQEHTHEAGEILTDHKTFMKIAVKDGFIHLLQVQIEGKNKMSMEDFLKGYKISSTKI